MFNLGSHLRHRYYKLLPSNGLYTKDAMLVQSSAADRCLMSASAFLAGFMPPLKNHNRLPIEWQPVPINSVPRLQDYVSALILICKFDFLYFLKSIVTSSKTSLRKVRRSSTIYVH